MHWIDLLKTIFCFIIGCLQLYADFGLEESCLQEPAENIKAHVEGGSIESLHNKELQVELTYYSPILFQ